MASNRFFTILIVPEKTQAVKKIVVPNYIFNGAIIALAFAAVLATIMVLDYANVMNQISENKRLKVENRQLKQSVQVFKNKMVTIENTLDRVKTFTTKLKIITSIESVPGFSPGANPAEPTTGSGGQLPSQAPQPGQNDASPNGGPGPPGLSPTEPDTDLEATNPPTQLSTLLPSDRRTKRKVLLAALNSTLNDAVTFTDSETSQFVTGEFERLDLAYSAVNEFAFEQEQETQFILERLSEKRILLASTPTRIPTLGYITSDYGVRISPIDGRRKMHEGLDIANRYGADVYAPADGTVVFASTKPGYGKMVVIDHGNGIETRYGHNSSFYVQTGARVKRGQRIAAVGSTGRSTGPHVHYEVHAGGLPVDPCWYILDYSTLCQGR